MGKLNSFIAGATCVLLLSIGAHAAWLLADSNTRVHKLGFWVESNLIHGEYLLNPLTGRCVTRPFENGHGWKINSSAEYFGCDKFQILINIGDFTKE